MTERKVPPRIFVNIFSRRAGRSHGLSLLPSRGGAEYISKEEVETIIGPLVEDLRMAAIRLGILTARMRGCHEETGKHELLDEAEAFVDEAKAALACHKKKLEAK